MNYTRRNIARMQGYVPGEQPQDRRYIKLNTNENPYPPSPRVIEALTRMDCERLRLYPDPVATQLREVAGELYGFTKDWVLCGNGSDDLLTIAVRTFVDQGGRLGFPTPSYSLYPVLAQLQDAESIAVPLDESFALPDGAAAAAKGASLFFVARPNAPTGNAFPLDAMHRLCREFPGVVWIDEAYVDFAADDCMDFVRAYDNVVVSRTLSKSYSLAGIRLGLAFASPDLTAEMCKVKDSYNVGMITQIAAIAALRDQEHMLANAARIRNTRATVTRRLQELGCSVLESAANFIFVQPPLPAAEVVRGLRERGLLVRYFDKPRTREFFRVTIGTDAEMAAFLAAAADILG